MSYKRFWVFGFILFLRIVNFLAVIFFQWYVSWRLFSSVVKGWEDVPLSYVFYNLYCTSITFCEHFGSQNAFWKKSV